MLLTFLPLSQHNKVDAYCKVKQQWLCDDLYSICVCYFGSECDVVNKLHSLSLHIGSNKTFSLSVYYQP